MSEVLSLTFETFLEKIDNEYYLDENRKSFIKWNFDILKDLSTGRLAKRNRFRQLLLGAVGKTSISKFLIALSEKSFRAFMSI